MKVTYTIDLDEEYDVDMLNNFLDSEMNDWKRTNKDPDNLDMIHIHDWDCNYSFKESKVKEE